MTAAEIRRETESMIRLLPKCDRAENAETPDEGFVGPDLGFSVELRRIELLTSSMPCTCWLFAGVR